MGRTIWDKTFFCDGQKPEPIHVADWNRQLEVFEEWNAKAERPEDKIEWDHRERKDPDTNRMFTYRIVYEHVKDVPEAVRVEIVDDEIVAYDAAGEVVDPTGFEYILDIPGAASVEIVDDVIVVYSASGEVLDTKVPKVDRVVTGVLIPVNSKDEIVFNSRSSRDVVAAYRRDKERRRKLLEEEKGIRYRGERVRAKGSGAEKMDPIQAVAGSTKNEQKDILEMIDSAAHSR